MPSNWIGDEELWDKAKKQAIKDNHKDNWAHVMSVYKSMGGVVKSLHLYLEGQEFEVLGELDATTILVKSNGDVVDMSYSDYYRAKKLFKSVKKNLSHLTPQQRLVTRDGKTFFMTVWVDLNTNKHYNQDGDEVPADQLKAPTPDEDFYRNKVAELDADIAVVWQLYTRQTYTSKNLGALAVREGVQNGLDAVQKAIAAKQVKEGHLDISWEGNTLNIEDNGVGMDVKTLHTKFLKIGGTTKRGEGDQSTGGFGVAKAVILGCGDGFEIETQDNYLNSESIGSGKVEQISRKQGTKLTIKNVEIGKTWDKKVEHIQDKPGTFNAAVLDYLESSVIPNNVKITVQGKEVKSKFIPSEGTLRELSEFKLTQDQLPEGTELKINVFPKGKDDEGKPKIDNGYIYIRLNGLTQYKYHLSYDSATDMTLDITTNARPGSDDYPFTTSREQLQGKAEGVIQHIREMMNKNPLALGDRDKYVDTVFDKNPERAKEKLEEQSKALGESFATKSTSDELNMADILDVLEEFTRGDKPASKQDSDDAEGIHAQGTSKQPSMLEMMVQQHKEIERKADEAGMSVEDYMQKQVQDGKTLSQFNPLENAWIVSREADYKTNFDAMKSLPLLVAWDAICRDIMTAYRKFQGDDYYRAEDDKFYPGFILEDKCLAMSASKKVVDSEGQKEFRNYIMINPEALPAISDEVLAGYLRSKACHELAHYVLGNGDGHGENHSYTREAFDDASLITIPRLEKLVKDAKLTKMVKKIKGNREKFLVSEKSKEERQKHMDNIQNIRDDFEGYINRDAVVSGLYDRLYDLDQSGYLEHTPQIGDEVLVFSKATPELFGKYVDVSGYNPNTRTVDVKEYQGGGEYRHYSVPSSGILEVRAAEKLGDYLRQTFDSSVGKNPHNPMENSDAVAHMMSTYYPSYKMTMNPSKLDYTKRMKVLKPILQHRMKLTHNNVPTGYSPSDAKVYVLDSIKGVLRPYTYTDYNTHPSVVQNDLSTMYDEVMSGKPSKSTGGASTKSVVEEPEDVKQYKSKLAKMSNDDVYKWANELGATWNKHDNPSINRMRAGMAIRSKVVKKSIQLVVRL